MIHIYKFNLQVSSSLNSRPLVWHAFSVFIFPINKCDKNKHTTVKEGERELYKTNIKSSYACEFIVLIHQYRSIWKKSFNNLRHRYVMSQIPFFTIDCRGIQDKVCESHHNIRVVEKGSMPSGTEWLPICLGLKTWLTI